MNKRPDGLEVEFHFASELGVAVKCGSQSLCESREAHERRSEFKEVTSLTISVLLEMRLLHMELNSERSEVLF